MGMDSEKESRISLFSQGKSDFAFILPGLRDAVIDPFELPQLKEHYTKRISSFFSLLSEGKQKECQLNIFIQDSHLRGKH